jgi:flagellar motor switch protein FliG
MGDANPALRKAAVLLSSLDAESAEALLRQIEPSQAELLRQAITALGEIDPREREHVAGEFLDAQTGERWLPGAGVQLDEQLAHRFDDAAARNPLADCAEPTFGFLQSPHLEDLSELLEHEQPQTIAVVVSHLTADRAAQLIAALPGHVQAEVLHRLVDLDEAHPEVIREIERGLAARVLARAELVERRTAGLSAVNNILAAADGPASQTIRRNLVKHDVALAQSLAQTPFLFSDLPVLDDASLWTLLSAADPDWVVLALAGAPPELAERVAGLLPPHEAADFRQTLDHLGPTRLSDVAEAQHRIAELARRLELEGELHLGTWRLGTVVA